MLRKIKELRDELDLLRTWWDVPAYIYKPGTSERLPRPAGEYPENDRRYWAATVKRLDVIAGLIRIDLLGLGDRLIWPEERRVKLAAVLRKAIEAGEL